jgi:hypothetical protein
MELEKDSLKVWVTRSRGSRAASPRFRPSSGTPIRRRSARVLDEVAERLRDNYPYFHPLYAGQMLKPPHAVARLAYALAMYVNPNNHALDGGRASSRMEKEAVAEIARMFGWDKFLGHLCGGGTMANLEALWIAGKAKPGATILASQQAHYTHRRISEVLGTRIRGNTLRQRGRMDMAALEARVAKGGVGTVVATMGTTAIGSVDPLRAILALRDAHGFRVHADAAVRRLLQGSPRTSLPEARAAFDCIAEVDSIVVDPHKHGMQPYGCGCVLFRDPEAGRFYKHDSPYTYFTSTELHLGEISLECSRAGASAVALWATQRLFPARKGWRLRPPPRALARRRPCAASRSRFRRPLRDRVRARARHRRVGDAGAHRERGLAARARRLRGSRAPRPASRARRAAGRVLRPRSAREWSGSGNHHVPALGAHEARARSVGRADSRAPGQFVDIARRQMLEARRQALDEEIRAYPTPIPRCDAQFNHLFRSVPASPKSSTSCDEGPDRSAVHRGNDRHRRLQRSHGEPAAAVAQGQENLPQAHRRNRRRNK